MVVHCRMASSQYSPVKNMLHITFSMLLLCCAFSSSPVVRLRTTTQYFVTSVLGEVNASVTHPLLNCGQGMHVSPIAKFGNG
jgi:hypothetical protein